MFIANLMASVLALAMVGASTASVSKIESNSFGSHLVLNRDIHKAYYDADGTYGTTEGTFFNYSSYYFTPTVDDGSNGGAIAPDSTGGFLADYNSNWNRTYLKIYTLPDGYQSFGRFAICDQEPAPYDGEDYLEGSVDLYLDGEFYVTMTMEAWYDPEEPSYTYPPTYVLSSLEGEVSYSYAWLFDHGTAPVPYTPVDILGDIAEGLTGGIVPVAEGIGNGLQSLVQEIFLNADRDGLSTFGIVIICFAGLALALGLSRWVLNFVDTLGARDR